MTEIDLTDGVDYVYFQNLSEKGAPRGEYDPCSGCIRICLDEIYHEVENVYVNQEQTIIDMIIEVLGHELQHKWYTWGMDLDGGEMSNEMDESVMRIIRDWVEYGKKVK